MARSMNTYSSMVSGYTAAQYADTGSRFSGVLRGALARSSDTGQVNWAGVTSLPASNTIRDYEVFAFSDSLQATKPIYIRLDWAGVSGAFYAQMQVGSSTNGAGVLSGIQYGVYPGTVGSALTSTSSQPILNFAATAVSPRYCYASSDGSYLSFFMNFQQAGIGATAATADAMGGFVVERTRDADGTPNGNGYMVWRWLATAESAGLTSTSFVGTTLRVYDTSLANTYVPATTFDFGAAVPPAGVTSAPAGGSAQAFPCYGAAPQPQGASKALALAYMADVPRMGLVTLTHYGVPTQWISCGQGQPASVAYSSAMGTASVRTASFCTVFRWE